MSESTSLPDNIDENSPRVVEAHTGVDADKTSASAYSGPLFKKLAITTVVISVVTIALLITTFIILRTAPWGNFIIWRWKAQDAVEALVLTMFAPLVISGISNFLNFPILLNVIIDGVLLACIIPGVVGLIGGILNSRWWCPQYTYPEQPAHLECLHWKSVTTILMGIGSGLTLLICTIYVVQLMLQGIAIFRTKLWKRARPLSWALPREINIQFSVRVLRQGEEGVEGSGHGPVYLS